jgi:hypothetical protein
MKLNRLAFRVLFSCLLVGTTWVSVVRAGSCQSGSLSNLIGTTCNVGHLQFTFGSMSGEPASDFSFVPVSDGFTLTFTGGPLSVSSAPGSGETEDAALLTYMVFDLNPVTGARMHDIFTSIGVSGGALSTTGTTGYSQAFYQGSVCGPHACIYGGLASEDDIGTITSYSLNTASPLNPKQPCSEQPRACFNPGSGILEPFVVGANGGNSASWDGSPTTFTWGTTTYHDPAPEPSSLVLFGTGLAGAIGILRRKWLS